MGEWFGDYCCDVYIVADCCAGHSGSAVAGFVAAIVVGYSAVSVCVVRYRYFSWHGSAHYAATGFAVFACGDSDCGVVRWSYAAGSDATRHSIFYEDNAVVTFHKVCYGGIVSWCGFQSGVETDCGDESDRCGVSEFFFDAFPFVDFC